MGGLRSTTWEPKTTTPAVRRLAEQIMARWFARTDCFPVQWYSRDRQMGGYTKACVNRPPWVVGKCEKKANGVTCATCPEFSAIPLTDRIVAMHLSGIVTLGSYQIAQDGENVLWLCADFDDKGLATEAELQDAVRLARMSLADLNVPTSVEASGGSGWRAHVWGFFSSPVPAVKARAILDAALRQCGVQDKPFIERFPKQTRALNGYGNLVKIPFGVHRKTGRRSQFLDDDLAPIPDVATALDSIQTVDPVTLDYTIDMRHVSLEETRPEGLQPAKNFDHSPEVMNRILSKCWYFREVERQQIDPTCHVHYEDWWNYVLMFSRFGEAGLDRIMRFSAIDDRDDPYYTMTIVNYVRQKGYHAPSCHRLRTGPGLILCPNDPLLCGAA